MTTDHEGKDGEIPLEPGQNTESMQMTLLNELTSLVNTKKRLHPRRTRTKKSPPVSLDPEYDPDTLDLFSELEAEIDREDELTDESIRQILSQLLDQHRSKIEASANRSIIVELESILACLATDSSDLSGD